MYNFVTKDYGLTEIGVITKNVLDKFWTCPKPNENWTQWTCPKLVLDMSNCPILSKAIGHVQNPALDITITGSEDFPGEMLTPRNDRVSLPDDIYELLVLYYNEIGRAHV